MRNSDFDEACGACGAAWVQSQAGAKRLSSLCTSSGEHQGGPPETMRAVTVAIERQTLIALLDATLKVADEVHCLPQPGRGNRQSRVERKRLARQSFCRTGGLAQAHGLVGVSHTTNDAREAGIGRSEARVDDGSLFEKILCHFERFSAVQPEVPKAAVIRFPCIEMLGRFMECSLLFSIYDGRGYGRSDRGGDFVLNGENVR